MPVSSAPPNGPDLSVANLSAADLSAELPGVSRRRRTLLLLAHLVTIVAGGQALSALAQDSTSSGSIGVPATGSTRIGSGSAQIALLVPPSKGVFQRAGEALIEGVRAAVARDPGGAVEVFEVGESGQELHALCERLYERGFALAIGPLTRNSVTNLAIGGAPAIPVLALNQTDGIALPGNVIVFGLSVENEAAQAANYAFEEAVARRSGGSPRAGIVHDGTPLSQRSIAAFIEQWHRLGGEFYEPIETSSESDAALRALVSQMDVDVYFVSATTEAAAALRTAVGGRAALYGASILNTGAVAGALEAGGQASASPELDGVRVIVMPWQVQRNHPIVAAYPRPPAMGVELQKLYALGIDAYRLAKLLLTGETQMTLDGVTGALQLDLAVDPRVERTPLLAEYRNGLLTPTGRRAYTVR